MHLMLALFWVAVGAIFFLLVEGPRPRDGVLPYPLTALAGVFAAFNVLRWWVARTTGGGNRGAGGRTDWKRPPLRRPGDDVAEPDPAFDFRDEPAASPPPTPGPDGAPDPNTDQAGG